MSEPPGSSRPFGDVRVVTDVPSAFAELLAAATPPVLALSGGDTARACYAAVEELAGPTVLFGDERWVPVSDPDSNEGMARAVLLERVRVGDVHSLRGVGPTPAAAPAAYDRVVASLPSLGLVHLGLGPDGHTASLFPASPALDVADRLVVDTGDDAHPHHRVTLTFPGIARADQVVVTVAGPEKADAWARLRSGEDLPAARVRAREVVWLVDERLA
jgi:6-phosphogluconolactonase